MAIFQKAYQGYTGPLSPTLSRMLVIFRYALADVFRSRLFVAFFFVSLLLPPSSQPTTKPSARRRTDDP